MKTLTDLPLSGKRVLIRADLNVPLDESFTITDDNRIQQFLPTLKYVIEQGGKAVVMSHFGDGNGKFDKAFSLKPVADHLTKLLGKEVRLAPDCIGPEVEQLTKSLAAGEVLLLENSRFHTGEKENDAQFAAALAKNGEVFIQDAFATAHRKHASMVGVPKLFKEKAPGFLMQKEMEYYEKSLIKPKPPLCVILGGSKVSTKLNALLHLVTKADKLIIGGAMANTFLAAQGLQMGRSLVERELFPKALEILGMAARRDCKLYLPVDFIVAPSPSAKGLGRPVPAPEVPADMMALDIGPASVLLFREVLHNAETIIWNGPMGAFENEDYAKGTTDMIEALASAHGMTVVGGGDTDAAIHKMELDHKFDYISTGGGAFLALLEGKGLPGFAALEN
ncbi:MAG: phosphoglycerate kinase [Deltaproteobacteria bacterium]|nr:phosphoglycerate kinase [Deltaproteobacteria bacterium]